jgi:hypothetical protein
VVSEFVCFYVLAGRCLITDVIDQEQAAEGLMVQYGVCDQLDALKDTYHSLPDFLTEVTGCSVEVRTVLPLWRFHVLFLSFAVLT